MNVCAGFERQPKFKFETKIASEHLVFQKFHGPGIFQAELSLQTLEQCRSPTLEEVPARRMPLSHGAALGA